MKVLMVCLGNICRSPLAEGILEHKAAQRGINMEVDSAGTSGWHQGEKPDSRSMATARDHGIDISKQRSRKFLRSDFEDFDVIFAMDESNYDNICVQASSETDREKVRLILNELSPGENLEVPDPYYGGDRGFEDVYQMLDQALDRFLDRL